MRFVSILVGGLVIATLAACGGDDGGAKSSLAAPEPKDLPVIQLSGASFQDGGQVPIELTCDGAAKSPTILWTGIPDTSKSMVIWMEDPDANYFVHWLVFDISPAESAITSGVGEEPILPDGSHQGMNGNGHFGYTPPCPPEGPPHRYEFHVYALDKKTELDPGATATDVAKEMSDHIIAYGKLTATYTRATKT